MIKKNNCLVWSIVLLNVCHNTDDNVQQAIGLCCCQLQGVEGSRIAHKSGVKVEATKLVDFVCDLISSYKTDNLGQNSFRDYLNVVELKKQNKYIKNIYMEKLNKAFHINLNAINKLSNQTQFDDNHLE